MALYTHSALGYIQIIVADGTDGHFVFSALFTAVSNLFILLQTSEMGYLVVYIYIYS